MGDVKDVCEALAGAVSTTGLRCRAHPSDQINTPEGHVMHRPFDPRLTLGGSPKRAMPLRVRVFVTRELRAGHLVLWDLMEQTGPTSIIDAINDGDNWPDDLVDYAEVVNVGEPVETTNGDTLFVSVDFDVDVVF